MALVSKNPQRQAGKVELLPGLKLWRVVDVTAEDYKGYDVDARVVLDGDRFTATEVRVRQRPGGPPVNGEALRQVALTGFITNAIGANTTLPPRMPVVDGAFSAVLPAPGAGIRPASWDYILTRPLLRWPESRRPSSGPRRIAAPWSRPISAAPPLRTCTPMRCRSSPLRPVPTRPR